MAPGSSSHRCSLQAGGRSQREGGADVQAGAEADQAAPDHLHRGAAGCTGGAVPAEPVSRREHEGEAGSEDTPEGRESGGETVASHSDSYGNDVCKFDIKSLDFTSFLVISQS